MVELIKLMLKQIPEMGESKFVSLVFLLVCYLLQGVWSHGDQPLSKVAVHKATVSLLDLAYIKASPAILGQEVSFHTINSSAVSLVNSLVADQPFLVSMLLLYCILPHC